MKTIRQLAKQIPMVSAGHRALAGSMARMRYEINDIYASYLSRSTKPTLTPYGFKLVGSQSVHHLAMQRGEFEPEETAIFKAEFERADVFVDVGANIGFFSCLARSAGKAVIAVEPLPRNLEHLFSNVIANDWGDVEVFPVGLSSSPGLATLYGASSTGASLIGQWAGASRHFQRRIALSTMDILLGDRFDGKRIFIKIDVEGVEHAVLCGAKRTLSLDPKPTWVIEICLNEYHPDGLNPHFRQTFDLFWERGYEVRTADRHDRLVQVGDVDEWVRNKRCDSGTINYRFVPLTRGSVAA
jgi:FkbM family methyltransferase